MEANFVYNNFHNNDIKHGVPRKAKSMSELPSTQSNNIKPDLSDIIDTSSELALFRNYRVKLL